MKVPELMTLVTGSKPVLLNVPHAGTMLPEAIKSRLRNDALELKDTDWHMDQLAAPCAELGASIMTAQYSRYVVDLNRSAEDTPLYAGPTTGLISQIDFDGRPLYQEGQEPDAEDVRERIQTYWTPYHQALEAEINRIKSHFGICLLIDLHSIRSRVPRLFDGVLPDLNLGTNSGASTAENFEVRAESTLRKSGYSLVKNDRFKGGYITRHYGQPDRNVHALQLEIAQSAYMKECAPWDLLPEKANRLGTTIKSLVSAIMEELEHVH
jgi:N-formylglutamate amidohydrolase